MSRITDIMIAGNFSEDEETIVEAELKKLTKSFVPFTNVVSGGGRGYEIGVYAASFNYLDEEEFIIVIKGLNDKLKKMNPLTHQDIQVFIQTEDMDYWHVVFASFLTTDDF